MDRDIEAACRRVLGILTCVYPGPAQRNAGNGEGLNNCAVAQGLRIGCCIDVTLVGGRGMIRGRDQREVHLALRRPRPRHGDSGKKEKAEQKRQKDFHRAHVTS